MKLVGVDFGSKMAGTTAIALYDADNQEFGVFQSAKNQDADVFLIKQLEDFQPDLVFIDAPLSLPKVYSENTFLADSDFFYREADRQLKAMSPLFLGGLTARAIRLKAQLKSLQFYETYPAYQSKRLTLNDLGYKKSSAQIPIVLAKIQKAYPFLQKIKLLNNWHQIDAILALLGAYRFWQNEYEVFGEEGEGQIFV